MTAEQTTIVINVHGPDGGPDMPMEVPAFIVAPGLAIHEEYEETLIPTPWTVTHVGSGWAMLRYGASFAVAEQAAMRLAKLTNWDRDIDDIRGEPLTPAACPMRYLRAAAEEIALELGMRTSAAGTTRKVRLDDG